MWLNLGFLCIDENKKRSRRPYSSWSIFCTVLNVNLWWKYMWLQALPNLMILACNKKWNEMQNTQKFFLVSRFLIRVARPAPFHPRISQSCKISWNISWKSPTFDESLCSLLYVLGSWYTHIDCWSRKICLIDCDSAFRLVSLSPKKITLDITN